jgi:hypothetical protein
VVGRDFGTTFNSCGPQCLICSLWLMAASGPNLSANNQPDKNDRHNDLDEGMEARDWGMWEGSERVITVENFVLVFLVC